MKKIILVAITSILIFTCFLTTKKANADVTDIFLNNEIYLFNNINEINFNEGYYIDKTTITEEDKNNDSNNYMWYFNLGHRLVARNFPEDSGGYKCLAIPLNNMVAKYVAFAFGFSRGPDLAIEVRYSDNSVVQYATSDYTDTTKVIYTPNEQDLTKNILYIAWEIYDPDYYISFLPLTSEGYYNIGYNDGLSDGFDNGMETGYNRGYHDGYEHAITSEEIIYDTTLNFNQIIQNGNFTDSTFWGWTQSTLTVENNTAIVEQSNVSNSFGIYQANLNFTTNHIYYCYFFAKAEQEAIIRLRYPFVIPPGSQPQNHVSQQYELFYFMFTYDSSQTGTSLFIQLTDIPNATTINKGYIKNVNLIDLTLMFGEGNEPTLEECSDIFISDYYEYTLSTPIYQGYYTGYNNGKEQGISEGINIGETNQINISWISSIFDAISGFLSIKIFPRVTVGVLVMIPFILTFTGFIIGVIRKGGDKGGDDE